MKRPLRNMFSLVAGDIGSRVLGFFITVYLARVLEPSAFGVINIGLSVLGYSLLLASPGIQLLETRNAASSIGVDSNRVNHILSLRLLLSVAVCALVSVASFVISGNHMVREAILLFSISLIPLSLFLDFFFQGKEDFPSVSAAKIISYTIYGAVVLAFVHAPLDFKWVPIGFAVGNGFATLFLFMRYRKSGTARFIWAPREWKSILVSNVPVGLAMFFAQSAINLPPIVIGAFISNSDAGIFSAAMKIIFVLLMLDRVVNALFLPLATRYFASGNTQTVFLLSLVTKSVFTIILPITLSGILIAPMAMNEIFGAGYQSGVAVLQILMGYFFLTLANSVFVCVLVASGHERAYSGVLNSSSVLFVVAIVSGTALFGMAGAAWGVIAGELVTVAMMFRRTKKIVAIRFWATAFRPLLAGVAMTLVMVLLLEKETAITLAAGLATFIAVAFTSRAIDSSEIRFLIERIV